VGAGGSKSSGGAKPGHKAKPTDGIQTQATVKRQALRVMEPNKPKKEDKFGKLGKGSSGAPYVKPVDYDKVIREN